jgi:hypothetical protein
MFTFKKLTLLASLFMVGMLLLAACGVEESMPTPLPATAKPETTETALPGPIVLPIETSDQFLAPQSYPAGDKVRDFAIADLDGDSFTDLAVADEWLGGVRVFLNNQEGSFQEGVEYATGEGTIGVVAADLDGDSYPDLAATNLVGATLSVLLNQGDGSFQPPVDYATGVQPGHVTTADLDNDLDIDLIAGHLSSPEAGEGSAGVWLNNGDGTFKEREDYKANRPSHLVAGDLNGDAYPDLAGRSAYYPEVSVLLNKGDATFEPAAYYELGKANMWPYGITMADLNGDTYPDLAVAVQPNFLKVLLNNGDGSFHESAVYETNGSERVVAGDLNGDSLPDLVVPDNNSVISVFWNKGDGTFVSRVNYSLPTKYGSLWWIDVADVDGDSFLDLVLSCNKGVHIFLNKGSD